MKSLIVPTILVGCMVPIIAGAMNAASSIIEGQEAHKFGTESGPLWTVDPIHVDRLAQNYERLPSALTDVPPLQHAKNLVSENALAPPKEVIASASNEEAASWCRDRYRSFDAASNTYQPLNGGPRRECYAPISSSKQVAQVLLADKVADFDEHARRCAAKYSSYRASDNTYQTFGGARRACSIDTGRAADLRASM